MARATPNKVRKASGEGYEAEGFNMWRRTNWQLWRLKSSEQWATGKLIDIYKKLVIMQPRISSSISKIQPLYLSANGSDPVQVPSYCSSAHQFSFYQQIYGISLLSLTIWVGVVGVMTRLRFGRSWARILVRESDLSFSGNIQTVFETYPAYFWIAIGNSFLRNVKRQLC